MRLLGWHLSSFRYQRAPLTDTMMMIQDKLVFYQCRKNLPKPKNLVMQYTQLANTDKCSLILCLLVHGYGYIKLYYGACIYLQ